MMNILEEKKLKNSLRYRKPMKLDLILIVINHLEDKQLRW